MLGKEPLSIQKYEKIINQKILSSDPFNTNLVFMFLNNKLKFIIYNM